MHIRVKSNAGPKLTEWEKLMKTAPEALGEMSGAMAEEVITLIATGWREQRNPYGEKWPPKKRADGRQILVGKTGRLRNSWQVKQASKRGFRVTTSVKYASPHQNPQPRAAWGGKSLPRRMMIPSRERGLPREWSNALTEVGTEILIDHFSRGKRGGGMSFISATKAGLRRRFNWKALVRKAVGAVSGE